MELNLKILAPLRQCTSKNRCALVIRRKNIYIILITRWIKIMPLIHSLSLSLSHSLSLSLISEHHSLSLTPSLRPLTFSLSHSGISLPHFGRPLTLSLSQLRSPKPPIHPFCRPNSPTWSVLACHGFFFFFFNAVDWWWWWWWW